MKTNGARDSKDVRTSNQLEILHAIQEHKVTSRAALSKYLGISKPAISENLAEFLSRGLIEEIGAGASTAGGGRRPTMIRISANHRYIVAIDLNSLDVALVLGNLNRQILQTVCISMDANASIEQCLLLMEEGINQLMQRQQISRSEVVYVAFAAPGVYNEQGDPVSINDQFKGLPWSKTNLCRFIAQHFGIRSFVMNDVKASTIGACLEDGMANTQAALYVSCGIGLGVGLVLDGQLYTGRRFLAGEVYNYLTGPAVQQAPGLEEQVCSSQLVDNLRWRLGTADTGERIQDIGALHFAAVTDLFLAGDAAVVEEVRQVCEKICMMALNFLQLMDVDTIIFGGDYAVFGQVLLQQMESLLSRYSKFKPKLKLCSAQSQPGIHGLMYLACEAYFRDVCQNRFLSA